jgi:hypothetical protein
MLIRFKTRDTLRICTLLLASVALAVPLILTSLSSAAATVQTDSSIAQGFKASNPGIAVDSLVGLQAGATDTVDLSSVSTVDQLVGIVSAKPVIDLAGGATTIQVVTSGVTSALVSDINGSVAYGDKITASPIEGVGMKATQSTIVVGIAQAGLDSVPTETRSIPETNGKTQVVHIGVLPIQVGVAYYALASSNSNAYVPGALQQIADNIVGHTVSPLRVLIAGLIILLLFISVAVLLYSAIRSSLIAIGRNPLSERAVRKGLVDAALTVVILLVFASAGIYLVLVT